MNWYRFTRCGRVLLSLSLWAVAPMVWAEQGHFHHLHMNVSSTERSAEFYRRVFGLAAVRYADRVPALAMERSFLFMNEVDSKSIVNHQLTGLTHGSWGTIDGSFQFEWLKKRGVEFYTPLSELQPGSTYMYLYGPDREVIEVTDASKHHRFNHIHMVADDAASAKATAKWITDLLDTSPVIREAYSGATFSIDDVLFAIIPLGERFTPRESDGSVLPTDGSHLDHVAFSFRDLDAAWARVQKLGMKVVAPPSLDNEYGYRHFFLRAPNDVLVEVVEARAWPVAAWQD